MPPSAATEPTPRHAAPAPAVDAAVAWAWYPWARLPAQTLHDLLKLRGDVFIVEQACAYDDIDGRDPACEHLVATGPLGGPAAGVPAGPAPRTLACLRLLPPGVKYAEASLGRLATHAGARRGGLAREAVRRGLARLATAHPDAGARISGQRYLQAFYESFGFVPVGAPYDEDGIPHQDLCLSPARVRAFGAAAATATDAPPRAHPAGTPPCT